MKKFLMWLFMFYSCAQADTSNNEIIGAFGLKLGDSFDIKLAKAKGNKSDSGILYPFKPLKKVRGISYHEVMVTPITHKIYNITGLQQFKNAKQCLSELNGYKAYLGKKYGKFKKDESSQDDVFNLRVGNRGIMLVCKYETGRATLLTSFVDLDLYKTSKKEHLKIKKKKDN